MVLIITQVLGIHFAKSCRCSKRRWTFHINVFFRLQGIFSRDSCRGFASFSHGHSMDAPPALVRNCGLRQKPVCSSLAPSQRAWGQQQSVNVILWRALSIKGSRRRGQDSLYLCPLSRGNVEDAFFPILTRNTSSAPIGCKKNLNSTGLVDNRSG
jgi:hypothetical protein